jgi:hypothetical protein
MEYPFRGALNLHTQLFFNIVRNKNAPVASVLSTIPVFVCFRCTLADENFEKWYDLVLKTNGQQYYK